MSSALERLRAACRSLLDIRYLAAGSSVFFFLVIGAALLLVYQSAGSARDQISADFNQQQLSLAKQAVYQIEGTLRDIELDLVSLNRFMEADPGRTSLAWAMRGLLSRNSAKGLLEAGVMDRQGRVGEWARLDGRAPGPPGRTLRECGEIGLDQMILGPLQVEDKEGARSLVTATACMEVASGGRAGRLLYGRIDVPGLVGAVTRHIGSGKTGYAWAIDEKGTFLSHPEEHFIGKSALQARKEKKPYISFAKINSIMKDRMLRGEEGAGEYVSGWHLGIEGEMAKLIAFTPVKTPALPGRRAWSVAVVAPKSEVAAAVHRIYTRHFAVGAAIITGMFVFGLLIVIHQYRGSQALQQKVEKTEADFHTMERIYERVVGQATDMIYVLDLDMRVVLLNGPFADMLSNILARKSEGAKEESYLGRSFAELLRPEDVSFMRSRMARVLERQASDSYEHSVDLDGRKTRLSTKLVPIRDDHGAIRLVLGITRDVTEGFEMDQRIYHAEKLASIGTLAAGVAHEINNPLGVILGFTDLLLEKFKPGSREHEDLRTIESQATNAKRIVGKLLGFARVTEGLEDVVDVKLALETVAGIVSNTLMVKKMELRVSAPERLPKVSGDSREFQQVIFNLIANSIAAMNNEAGRIVLKAWADGDWVRASVSDTGSGIPESIRPRIFDPFFTTKKVGAGTGLGLSLCYGIVKKYGGSISFTSVSKHDHPDQASGTTFTVSMPIRRAVEKGPEGAPS
ncbi:MAG: PAS domain-containing protein [Elusimicrobia bacterium]|nr:PAS domain-containing protein [Elusimicrobiota bacterium]